MSVKLAIADPDPVFTDEISAEFDLVEKVEVVWSENKWDDVQNHIKSSEPDVILFGPGWSKTRVLPGFKGMIENQPDLQAILVTSNYTTELRREAAEIGFAGVFAIPIDGAELLMCIRRISAGGRKRKRDGTARKGRCVTVFSTKGGVGKTVVATNLAVSLARGGETKTIVLDLDLQFGDVGVMLKLIPKHTLFDLVSLTSIDLGQIQSLLTKFDTDISAFVAPLQPELADLVTPAIIKPVYEWLRQAADYIIIDTPPCFNDNVLGVLEETDELYLVATLDLPSLKNIKLCLQTLALLGFPKEKTHLVLNRVDGGMGLSPGDVEKVFKEKISGQIPNDPAVQLAVNKGRPVVLDAPKCAASKAIFDLSAMIRAGQNRTRKKVRQGVTA